MTYTWIAEQDRLEPLLDKLRSAARIGLDTEFMRVRTFLPELALVQVAVDGHVTLVDPVDVALAALGDVLAAARPLKIMHSASEDLVALSGLAAPLEGLFDTQIAAAFAGFGAGVGYQRLVAEIVGVELEKAHTRSNWLARPLSPEQLHYAAADVEHLQTLHDVLSAKLEHRGMTAWLAEDCARLARQAAAAEPPANLHWEYRNGWRLPLAKQARLKRVLDWRETLARTINRPRLWILDNATAIALVERPPAERRELSGRLSEQRSFPKRAHEELFALLTEPLPDDALAIEPIPAPLRGDGERLFATLKDRIAARAADLDLPPALLAPRRLIEAIVRGERPPELDGWRGEVLHDLLDANATPPAVPTAGA
jgi:ribonuclease D